MRSSTIVCLLMACLAVSCLAKASDNAGFVETYGVCKNASSGNTPGGWRFLTESELKNNKVLLAHAKKNVNKAYDASWMDSCSDKYPKQVTFEKIKVACVQIANGKNYEYGAQVLVRCDGKVRQDGFSNKFNVPAVGK